jgi:molybdopterin biosynthesis enzyme
VPPAQIRVSYGTRAIMLSSNPSSSLSPIYVLIFDFATSMASRRRADGRTVRTKRIRQPRTQRKPVVGRHFINPQPQRFLCTIVPLS